MSDQPLVEFQDAALGYGRKQVLSAVNFRVRAGAFVGIFGHNGSGKTTLLRSLLGLIPIMSGRLAIAGTSGALRFGYVPQKEKLDPIYPLSAFEVAAMGSYRKVEPLARLRGKGRDALVRECLARCGALELAPRPYSALSGGQKQRVLIARALTAEPEMLVLDEPLAGIDITTQRALLALLSELKKGRLTILMVSHRIQAERDLLSEIAWVDQGKVEQGGAEAMLASHHIAEVFRSEL